MICLSHRSNWCFLYLIHPARLSILRQRNYPDVQPWGMSDWQMTHNNGIAYASWDINSLATLLFVKQLVKANIKENIRPSFCERMESPHTLDHQSSTPVIPCNGNPLVTSGFTAHRDNNVINYWMTNYITATSSEFYEFSTHLHLHCLFNSSFGQTWKKTSKLRFFCDEDWNKWRHHTLGQQCGNL